MPDQIDALNRSVEHAWQQCEAMERQRDEAREAAETYHKAWQDAAVYWLDKVARLEDLADLWKQQRAADNQQWRARWQRQVDLTNTFRGRWEVLRHENNRLRRKVQTADQNASAADTILDETELRRIE